jgi:predicted ribosome quality control (RQC) complex YloA/Tae2 family protein
MLLLLRKYAQGARLVAITQMPLERVLTFSLSGPEGAVSLVCEAMGRLSNVILVDAQGHIMDALKRVPGSINRVRTVLPHQPYVPPPPQEKDSPLGVTVTRLGEILAQGEGPAWRRLVDGVGAISPVLAREIIYRATGSTNPPLPLAEAQQRAALEALDELWHLPQTGAWAPCVAYEGEGAGRRPRVCAPYRLTHLPDVAEVASISEAVLLVREAQGAIDPYQQVRARLHGVIAEQVARHEARLASLHAAHVPEAEIELLQMQGNAILAMGWALKPGQRELVVNPVELGLAEEGAAPAELRIPLDPALSAAENAQDYFRRYRKRRDAADQVPELIGESEREMDYLRQLAAEVDLADDRGQLDEVEAELRAAGYLTERKRGATAPATQPLRVRTPEGDLILIGRNSQQNHELTFRRAGPDDLWLHAHGVPGSHVIVKVGGGALSDATLLRAAQLAACYSTARQEGRVQVDWVARRHVHPMKGGRPGMVVYTHEQTLVVSPEPLDPDEQD